MGKLTYIKGSLFETNFNEVIVHACNAKGVWGSGIAVDMKKLHPKSFEEYKNYCTIRDCPEGSCFVSSENVACLITSIDYGKNKSPVDKILKYTETALDDLLTICDSKVFHSNKFNSGLFGVPWEKTEEILLKVLEKYDNVEWVVHEL